MNMVMIWIWLGWAGPSRWARRIGPKYSIP